MFLVWFCCCIHANKNMPMSKLGLWESTQRALEIGRFGFLTFLLAFLLVFIFGTKINIMFIVISLVSPLST